MHKFCTMLKAEWIKIIFECNKKVIFVDTEVTKIYNKQTF